MNNEFFDYMREEKNASSEVAATISDKICKYEDIKNDFLKWLKCRNYNYDNPLEVLGYKAKDIVKIAPFLDGVGVYTFMVTLRDNPEEAYTFIQDGFIEK